jgi:hypothetical protein
MQSPYHGSLSGIDGVHFKLLSALWLGAYRKRKLGFRLLELF